MRALLVCNPKATTTSDRVREVLVRALRSETELDVAYTRRRGHGASLARDARKNGVDVVVALGGDGTVNEVVNGLLADGTDAERGETGAHEVPALAVVSGGSTNVFARALGLPTSWAEGTAVIIEALREGRTRRIGLGKVKTPGRTPGIGSLGVGSGRYFTFCAGFGLDADVIHRVEIARRRGRKNTPFLYMQSMAGNFLFDRGSRQQRITLEGVEFSALSAKTGERTLTDGDDPEITESDLLSMVVVQNTAPWTYIGERAIHANPDASFDLGLDVMAMRSMNPVAATRMMTQLLAGRTVKETGEIVGPHGKQVLRMHDLSEFTLRANLSAGLQLDGEYLGEPGEVSFSAVQDAIRVVC
jgi:diacylglycerol kinase family enzyme